jgi:hypothetical protein
MSDRDISSDPGWRNFQRRPPYPGHAVGEDPAATRFAIGLSAFLIVAIAYPWYSYWVSTRLLAADLEAGLRQVASESAAASAHWRSRMAIRSAREVERERQQRIASVVVHGIGESSGPTVVIVDLGSAGLEEATPAICAQLQRQRGARPGDVLRVQRFRGSEPALSVGSIRCY